MQSPDNFPSTPSAPGPPLKCPNVRIEPITTATDDETYGTLNQHPSTDRSYQIGISDDQGPRATMEDSYGFIVDFDSIRGQGLFGMFDGHGNKMAAEWCGAEFHKHLLQRIHDKPTEPIPEALGAMFSSMDGSLSQQSQKSANMAASGCTAVAAFLRIEDAHGHQPFATSFLSTPDSSAPKIAAITPPPSAKRVLYCANAGDTRVVLSRGGKAERLTYDHKATDKSEIDRVRKADGIIFRGRVLGYLNLTRSLGNHEAHDGYSLKKYVVGTPNISKTELSEKDKFFIVACDGLWDVTTDQEAVDLIRDIEDAQVASKTLLDHAFKNGTRDNVTVMVCALEGDLGDIIHSGRLYEVLRYHGRGLATVDNALLIKSSLPPPALLSYPKSTFTPLRTTRMQLRLSFAAVLSLAVVAQANPTARFGLFCCPKTADGVALTEQHVGHFALRCSYGEKRCKYASGSGYGAVEGCPARAVVNANPPTCD
ncbi:hypothetical protein D9615_002546 [Tricholomella constricta]|uniref:PPM-type phosphatase domain-containing protein n=1 Tax=Tricholomella constricta TaxID=117010 RepID=A0A8H5M9T7_9AGAR|nr:hypothetical protein D9615_002546 [Tricholomella constricta]